MQPNYDAKPSGPASGVTNSQHRKSNLMRPYYIGRMNEQGYLDYGDRNTQFIIPIGSEVRFQVDSGTPISKEAVLLVNKPKRTKAGEIEYTITQPFKDNEDFSEEFNGSKLDTDYMEKVDAHPESSQYLLEFRVTFKESGSFFVQIAYQDAIDPELHRYSPEQYINVEPVMSLRGREIRSKELSLMTVMSRCLGKMKRWPEICMNIRDLGYNAIHFTPFQQYGESFSHYSIAGQTTVDDYYFDSPASITPAQRIAELKSTMDGLRSEGLLSIVDIVLNHTANDSKWIVDYPEASYNTDDCPHLWSAWVLDKSIQDFSLDYANKKIPECPSAPYVSNETDLGKVMHAIRKRVIDRLNVYQYFDCNVNHVINQQLKPAIGELDQAAYDYYKRLFQSKGFMSKNHFDLMRDEFTVGHGSDPNKLGVQLKMPDAAFFFMIKNNKNRDAAVREVEQLLGYLNDDWKKRCVGYMNDAMGALEGNIRYHKTELGHSKITPVNRIVEPYFSELNNKQRSKVAHNGWVMGHNCMEDFGYIGWHYLKRSICIWADNIKLRYGQCPADSPYLWEHMTKYVQDMANCADGFRLDNTHSTPIHVCQYLLQAARTKNKNLFVMAELFTNSSELDALFCKKLNLNGLVRELQNRGDVGSTGAYFHQLSCQQAMLGSIDENFRDLTGREYKFLKSKKPEDMLYDCTHDNPSVLEKFQTGRMALPHIGLTALADISIASTWGYDFLVKEQIHCVSEKRLYPTHDQRDFVNADPALEQQRPKQQNSKASPTSFEYEFSLDAPTAGSVAVVGDFNNWKPTINLQKGSGGTFKGKATLPTGGASSFQYKFLVNNTQWTMNPNAPKGRDSNGHENNLVTVPGSSGGGTMMQSGKIASQTEAQKTYEDVRYPRMIANRVHSECTKLNAEIFMHQQDENVLVVTRQLPLDHYSDFDAYVSISRYCFYNKGGDYFYKTSIELPGFVSEVVFAGYLEIPDSVYGDPRINDKQHLYGPRGCKLESFNHIDQKFCTREKVDETKEKLNFHFMPPSFTCILKVKSRSYMKDAYAKLSGIYRDRALYSVFDENTPSSAINHVLFRCEHEEHDISGSKRGTYGLSNYGQFPYSGLTSFMHTLDKLKVSKDMGNELFENLRAGDWYIDYATNRISLYAQEEPSIGLQKLSAFMQDYFAAVKQLPAYMKPKMASRVIEAIYRQVVKHVMSTQMLDDFVGDSEDPFVQKLALACYQMYGRIPSVYFKNHKDSMCAGLPHFSTGYMRCWGRDTFIALRGLNVVTGLEDDARNIILFFAKVMRHGLLPNLHDGGGNTRFNSRDAPWFFLQAIKDYCKISDEGLAFLKEKFELHFKDDDQLKHQRATKGRVLTILEQIIEICQRHREGMDFREWNAGTAIDAHMKDQGFNVKLHCSETNGFCFGGNVDNCGTWMDKMGSSDYTKNRGKPATPRDGAPIELVCMQYSILIWLAELHKTGKIPMDGFNYSKNGQNKFEKFGDWAAKMKSNFEKCFWIPTDSHQDNQHDIKSNLVNRRGVYKDVYGSTDEYTDYQLRCNICIGMSYAPELFNRKNAQICLKNVADILMEQNCMGIKTLDPKDRNYNGDYINSDESSGWNYHQGPEWVWPVGFFLKAQLIFNDYETKEEAAQDTMKWLLPHKRHIMTNRWQGLPELTNSHGQHCDDSCVTQAWSISTILDAMRDLYYYGEDEEDAISHSQK